MLQVQHSNRYILHYGYYVCSLHWVKSIGQCSEWRGADYIMHGVTFDGSCSLLIYSFALVLCYFLLFCFPKNKYFNERNECNENTTTGTINQPQLRMRNDFFVQKIKKKLIIALQREKCDVAVVLVVTWSL